MIISLYSLFINPIFVQSFKSLVIRISKRINTASLPVTYCIQKVSSPWEETWWPETTKDSCQSGLQVVFCPGNGEFRSRTAAAQPSQLLTSPSQDSAALMVPRKPREELPSYKCLPVTPDSLEPTIPTPPLPFLNGSLLLFLIQVCAWLRWLKPRGTVESPSSLNEFKEGVKKAILKLIAL